MRHKSLRIWHISDTHTYHNLLEIPKDCNMVIFSGDCSNPRNPYINEPEVREFLNWFKNLPIKHKIFVAGNHDTSIEKGLIEDESFEGIYYLENDWVEIEGIKFWGSPHTPRFGDWAFMKSRHKIGRVWEHIPTDVDVIIAHGPPRGVLDLSYSPTNKLEMCGCSALRRRIDQIRPRAVLFGHIHNNKDIINTGTQYKDNVLYSNGSVVTDRKFGILTSNGNIIDIS